MRILYLFALIGLAALTVSGQTYLTPGVAMSYSKFAWASPNIFELDDRYNLHISPGLGVLHDLGEFYSINLHHVLYKGAYQVSNGVGINPVQRISHGTLDSDISLCRKLSNSIVIGAGFKHLLFYNVKVESLASGEKYNTINGLGYHLRIAYESNRFGVLLAYNQLYNYRDDGRSPLTYDQSTTLDFRIYYKLLIINDGSKRRE